MVVGLSGISGYALLLVTLGLSACANVTPDGGSARADFPGGDARTLYRSMRRILDLPPATRLFMCHDYAPGGREIRWQSSVAEERAGNIHVRDGIVDALATRREVEKQIGGGGARVVR